MAARVGEDGLNDRQRKFVDAYLICQDPVEAYRKAGYQAKTNEAAQVSASQILSNLAVKEVIAKRQRQISAATDTEAARVVAELALVGFSDIGAVLDFSGTEARLRPACEITEAARRAISSVKVRCYTEGRGDAARTVEVTEFKLWDKLSALDKLARRLRLYEDDRDSEKDAVPLVINIYNAAVADASGGDGAPE
jgi:phage terminase small subunit